ncbi:MAG: MltA domain-containing protein [Acidobacteriota bacterium]
MIALACAPPPRSGDLPAPPPVDAADAPAPIVAETALRRVEPAELPPLLDDGLTDASITATLAAEGLLGGDRDALRQALTRSRDWYRRQPDARRVRFGPDRVTMGALDAAYTRVLGWLDEDLTAAQLGARLAYHFRWYESVGAEEADGTRRGRVLVTGYYEPVIEASLRRRPGYDVPIYGPPQVRLVRVDLGAFADDLAGRRVSGLLRQGRLVPFPDRAAVRAGEAGDVLGGREIAWAKNEVDVFFLEVQGSGSLRLPDGRLRRIGYASANGHAYRSIGKLLIDQGKIARERMSMQALRSYLDDHPEEVRAILDHNRSMVFFRFLDGPPVGSIGVSVTPGRSIATDRNLMPKGALGLLVTEVPRLGDDGRTVAEGPLVRLVLNQDTGGAIKGPARVDFFWGRGPAAGARAGAMKQPGRLVFFAPRTDALPRRPNAPPEDDDPAAAAIKDGA